jgi:hypothetical protein
MKLAKSEIQQWIKRWSRLNQTPRVKMTLKIWKKLI